MTVRLARNERAVLRLPTALGEIDFAAVTARSGTLDTISVPPAADNRYAIWASVGDLDSKRLVEPIQLVDASIGTNPGFRNVDTALTNCEFGQAVKVNSTVTTARLRMSRCKVANTYANQVAQGANSASILGLIGDISRVEVHCPVDAMVGIGGPYSGPAYISTVDLCWLHQQSEYPFSDGYAWDGVSTFPLPADVPGLAATTGAYLTAAQMQQSSEPWQPGVPVEAGTVCYAKASSLAGNWVLQCVAAGTSGTGLAIGVPTVQVANAGGGVPHPATVGGNPFPRRLRQAPAGEVMAYQLQGGTAWWVTLGIQNHTDGMQWSAGGHCTVTRSRIDGADNAAVLVQAGQAPSDGANVPPKLITFRDCYLAVTTPGATAHIMQVNTAGYIAPYGTSGGGVMPGWYTRAADGTWSVNAQGSRSRPWYISVLDCAFGDHADGPPTFAQSVYTASRMNDVAVFVRDEATRDAGVAAQYGITVEQAAAMRVPGYDWTGSTPVVDTAVLDARLATFNAALTVANASDGGAHQGKVDARSWIVWRGNRQATTGALLHPTPWAGKSGFDADGYYTGG